MERIRLVLSKLTEEIWQILTWAVESSKLFTLISSYWAKYMLFELKRYRGVIFHETKERYIIWRNYCLNLLLRKWNEEFCKFSPEHLKLSKLEFWWDPFVQSRKCMSLKYVEEYEEWYKNWTRTDFSPLKYTWGTSQILTRALESLKYLSFNWLLLTKVYIIWATKVQRS